MQINKIKIGCVIPCYKGGKKTIDVIKVAQNYVDLIVLIDDKCPFKTGDKVKNIFSTSNKVKVIFNLRNLGVGGATKIGIDFLEKQNCDIIVKVDADGQLNPELIPALIKPLVDDEIIFLSNLPCSIFPSLIFTKLSLSSLLSSKELLPIFILTPGRIKERSCLPDHLL